MNPDRVRILRLLEHASGTRDVAGLVGGCILSLVCLSGIGLALYLGVCLFNHAAAEAPIAAAWIIGTILVGLGIGFVVHRNPFDFSGMSADFEDLELGCLGSILQFLCGTLYEAIAELLKAPALTRNQLVAATALVEVCLSRAEVDQSAAIQAILRAGSSVNVQDCRVALRFLIKKDLLVGGSTLALKPETRSLLEQEGSDPLPGDS